MNVLIRSRGPRSRVQMLKGIILLSRVNSDKFNQKYLEYKKKIIEFNKRITKIMIKNFRIPSENFEKLNNC